MTARRILTLICAAFVIAEARWHEIQKRDTTSMCDTIFNDTRKVQCYCARDVRESNIRSADCFLLTEDVKAQDQVWDNFEELRTVNKLTLSNSKSIALQFIPTNGLKYITGLLKLDVKYGYIETIQAFAFANLSSLEEVTLRDSQIKVLEVNAFAHHNDLLAISLDKNNIEEINRDVFINLPSLEKLFLTSNKITTIHDRAFVHLISLKELEINMNSIFSLNSETFSGLKKLQKLDLSSNNLEVIGDNTFLPLGNLKSLNLAGNKIQMLDEKAFHGLFKLHHLSLAHNKLKDIDNVKIFEGLNSLSSLNLRANEIRELKTNVMAPLMNNFYESIGNLDVEDNNFSCDCRLDWFLALMNRTQSKSIKMAMENFKCVPTTTLRDTWMKLVENDRSSGQVFEEESQGQPQEYEYYDDTQLNGKLFYTDVRYLLNCTGPNYLAVPTPKTAEATTVKPVTTTIPIAIPKITTKVTTSPKITTTSTVATISPHNSKSVRSEVINRGLLDLSTSETTANINEVTDVKTDMGEKKPSSYTTSRLATVSAKPFENKMYEDGMASDEAKPDKLKAHRSIHEELKDTPIVKGSAHMNLGCVMLILMISLRLLH